VHVDAVDGRQEVVELVERTLLDPPVEAVAPVREQLLEIRAVGAVLPGLARPRVRKTGACETILQVAEDGIGDRDRERADRVRVTRGRRGLCGWGLPTARGEREQQRGG
jgi:hypothetical protein